jgi:PBP1b-binding outer membrane lipoprotein LpoB
MKIRILLILIAAFFITACSKECHEKNKNEDSNEKQRALLITFHSHPHFLQQQKKAQIFDSNTIYL